MKKLDEITNYIGVNVRYQCPTDYDGAQVTLTLPRMVQEGGAPTVSIGYDHAENSCPRMAANHIFEETGLIPVGQSQADPETGGTDILFYEFFPSFNSPENNLTTLLEKVFS